MALWGVVPALPGAREPEISKKHWMPVSITDVCQNPDCRYQFRVIDRKVNCRRCGLIYCSDCVSWKRKLNLDAEIDDEHGTPFKVCKACYEYNNPDAEVAERSQPLSAHVAAEEEESNVFEPQTVGFVISHTEAFLSLRNRFREEVFASASHYLTRLEKISNLPPTASGPLGSIESLFGKKTGAQLAEEQGLPWKNDEDATDCDGCLRTFTFTVRKHHCRLCGQVFCAECSAFVAPFSLVGPSVQKEGGVKVCQRCRELVGDVAEAQAFKERLESAKGHILVKFYTAFRDSADRIESFLGPYENMLVAIEDPSYRPDDIELFKSEALRRQEEIENELKRVTAIATQVGTIEGLTPGEAKVAANLSTAIKAWFAMLISERKIFHNALQAPKKRLV